MGLKFERKERFYAALKSTVPKITAALTDANRKSAEEMVAMAKRLAPVESGALRDSIQMRDGPRETSFIIDEGAGPDYETFREYGTVKLPAQPHFWPAYRAMRKRFRGRASRVMGKAIKEAGF